MFDQYVALLIAERSPWGASPRHRNRARSGRGRLAMALLMLAAIGIGLVDQVAAETVPDLPTVVKSCHLIVSTRVELVDDRLLCRVVDSLRGNYKPSLFLETPPAGYIDPIQSSQFAELDPGEQAYVFYRDQAPGQNLAFRQPELILIAEAGRIVYPSGGRGEFGAPCVSYALDKFEQLIRSYSPSPKPGTRQVRPDMAIDGPWKLLLPAGYEYEVRFTPLNDKQYRLEPGWLSFGGIYEVHGERIVRVPDDRHPHLTYEWKLRSRYLATLDKQPPHSRPADYDGAVFFRPK